MTGGYPSKNYVRRAKRIARELSFAVQTNYSGEPLPLYDRARQVDPKPGFPG
jgi:hypothetical protein